MKLPVFGLHVGNSTASLAVYKEDGKIDVISNEIGDRVTPAIVTILNHEKLVGSVAKSLSFEKFHCTVNENKRLMNRSLSDIEKEEACRKYRVGIEYDNGELCYCIPFNEKLEKYTPAQIATLIYKKLYDTAKSAIHAKEGDSVSCVILVPTYFDSDSTEYTKNAVESAGWNILQIVSEPVAPILAYSLLEMKKIDKKQQFERSSLCSETLVMVYHLGGVSCEATVLRIFSGMVQIRGTSHRDSTGADHLVRPLTSYLTQEFYRKYKLDASESKKSMGKLRQAAEICMHSLSNLNNTDCFVESLYEGVDFKHSVSRARLETYLSPLLSVYTEPIHDVLQKTGLSTDGIQKVILCGGLMKIPKLQSHIAGMFTNAEVLSGLAPDEVMAYGAAQQAGYILSYQHKLQSKNSEATDLVLPVTCSAELTDQLIEVRIMNHCNKYIQFEKYSLIPCHKKVYIDNVSNLEGEHQMFLFEVLVEGEIKLKGEEIITKEENTVYEVDVIITKQKQFEIKFTVKNFIVNKKQHRVVLLKPVNMDI